MNTTLYGTKSAMSKVWLALLIACALAVSGASAWSVHETLAYAKEIGEKNRQACDNCEAVVGKQAPDGYTSVLGAGDTSVFRGGDSLSKWVDQSGWWNGAYLDHDPNDFAKPLPYGNTYIDTSKLTWDNPSGFIIDIQDDRFIWASAKVDEEGNPREKLKDAKGFESTFDPMGQDKGSSGADGIYYVGELHSYLPNITDAARNIDIEVPGVEGPNMIEPQNGAPYLYRITYLNAVTLPDGTKGNLQLTMEKMQLESSFTTNAANPYVISEGYSYDKAIIRVQGPNELALTTSMKDDAGNGLNPREFVAITAADATQIMSDVNANLPDGQKLAAGWNAAKTTRHAVGGIFDLGIVVLDQDGNARPGTISYAAHDLDLSSAEGIWGRPITRNADGTYDTKFGEGMRIVNGSLSYALTPKYEHDGDGTTQATGWVERGPFEKADKDSPLAITRDMTGAGTGPADGVRFSTSDITNLRDKDGKFEKAIFNANSIRTPQSHSAGSGQLGYADLDDEQFGGFDPSNPNPSQSSINTRDNYKKLIYGMMKRDGYANAPTTWEYLTMTQVYDYLGDASWRTDRNDDDLSFDTGFAVLLNAEGSTLQWSASRLADAAISTKLFDSTMYTYVETTHGTGGGIYLETYDTQTDCEPIMNEGVVTMGRHSDSTVTAVPEDGYRVNRILVGNTNFGQGSAVTGLTNYTEYVIDGNDIIVDGDVVGTFAGSDDVAGQDGLKTGIVEVDGFNYDSTGARTNIAAKILIERNADGTVDIELPDIDDPMHVHVDFGADYYFYKVWIDGDPTELDMTVAPAGFYPTDVEIPVPTGEIDGEGKQITELVKFEINGNTYTAQGGTYLGQDISGYDFTLTPNNTIEYVEVDETTGDETLAIRPNVVLEGNSFVHKTDGVVDAEYPITIVDRVADWNSVDAKGFKLNQDAIDAGYIEELDESNTISPGNKVWKVKYPSDGVQDLQWPALPVEKEPTEANHQASNHTDRNYWFAVEEVPHWSTESYSNEQALVPGVKEDTRYHQSNWYQSTIKDHAAAEDLVHVQYKDSNAFLSVFENGGEIVNVPSIIVRGQKVWVDDDNTYNNRQDIWLHIDLTIENNDGSTTTRKDVLPPQKLAKDASGNALIKTWGTKTSYNAEAGSNVKVVGTMKQVPSNAILQSNGSYQVGNKIYWVNELKAMNGKKEAYTYSIRETLDREGNQPVEKDDPDAGLVGYTSDDLAAWDEMTKDTGTIKGNDVDRYTGTVTNTLERVEVKATKVWDDNNDQDGYRQDVTFALDGLDGDLPNAQEKEVTISKDNNTQTVTWTGLPKYKDGKAVQYDVTETGLDEDHYDLAYRYVQDEDGNPEITITNIHTPETASVSIFKKWDDANNQDGLRKEAAKVQLEGKTDSESQYQSVSDQGGKGITQGVVPVEDGLIITWLNIPVKRNGEVITYKVSEDISGLGGYYTDPTFVDEEFTLTNGENKEATITNKETPELTEITITKEWDDMDDHDGIRPSSVTVQFTKTYQELQETTEEVDKEVTVNGAKYVVKTASDGTEYYAVNGKYYRGDEVDEVNDDVTNNEELVPFDPDDTGEVVLTGKTVDIGDDFYFVKVTADGVEYYQIEDQDAGTTTYYDANTNEELTPGEGNFNPTAEDKDVKVPAVSEIDGTEYEIKIGNLAGEEQWYIEKDGKYYDWLGEDELIVFTPAATDETVKTEATGDEAYEEKTESKDIVLSAANKWTTTISDLPVNTSVGQKVIYSVDEVEVPEGYTKTVISTAPGKFTVTNKHEAAIKPPVAEPDETLDYKGKPQTGVPTFKADPDTRGPGGTENKIERITLVDDDGNEVDSITVPGEGTYKLTDNGDGTCSILFTPEPDFVGKTSGVKVRGYDSNGLSADTTYTPTVIHKVKYVDPLNPKGKQTVKGPEDSNKNDGSDITDPPEYVVGEESPLHPGQRFDGWDEEEIDDPDNPGEKIIVRTAKFTPVYKIVYDPNGGTGDMADNNYAADDPNKPFDENSFTRKGYSFKGFKAYITDPTTGEETPILDENGEPLIFNSPEDMAEYFKDMPGGTSIRMEAQWKPDSYTIKYDANGGSGTMETQYISGADGVANSKTNEFTREGYKFVGFKAMLPDGSYLLDDNGNELIFTSTKDFFDYLAEHGDGAEVTLIAQWEPISNPSPSSSSQKTTPTTPTSSTTPKTTSKTGDSTPILPFVFLALVAAAGMGGALALRRANRPQKQGKHAR